MKRYSTIQAVGSDATVVDYTIPLKKFGKSLTDKSHFVPIADAVAGLTAGNRAHLDDGRCYDFADGKDDGRSFANRKRSRDIAEVFQDKLKGEKALNASISEARAREASKQATKKAYDEIMASTGSPAASSSNTTGE